MIKPIGKMTPRPYQQDAINAILGHIREQWTSNKETPETAILSAFVSAGKTCIMGGVSNYAVSRGRKVLILARQGELVEQTSETLWLMDTKNSIFSASLGVKSTHYDVVVGTEGTVSNHLDREFSKWIPNIIIIDEAHTVPWQDVLQNGDSQYSRILNHIKSINKDVVIIGVTGTPMRGCESIIGPYWDKKLEPDIGREFLTENGFIVPTIFGSSVEQYDLDEFKSKGDKTTEDYSSSELAQMAKKMDLTTTHKIMNEVIDMASTRNGVLITCASKRHCEEAASALPDGTWGIITTSLGNKERRKLLKEIKSGEKKYLLQIGCVSTGFDAPIIDTSVILRRIGSLTLLIQLLGRGMRLLKQGQIDAGIIKHDHLVLDFSGTMASMHELYENPILEDAQLQKDKANDEQIPCPKCMVMNGINARRCIGDDTEGTEPDGRCGYFFTSRICEDQKKGIVTVKRGCGAENDIAARECRCCGIVLIDPNEKLTGTSYGIEDWKPVLAMEVSVAGRDQDAIQVKYHLDSWSDAGEQEIATVMYWAIKGNGKRTWVSNFVRRHINGYQYQNRIINMTPFRVVESKSMFDIPTHITHRLNDKGKSIVHGLKFRSGKTLKGSKLA